MKIVEDIFLPVNVDKNHRFFNVKNAFFYFVLNVSSIICLFRNDGHFSGGELLLRESVMSVHTANPAHDLAQVTNSFILSLSK